MSKKFKISFSRCVTHDQVKSKAEKLLSVLDIKVASGDISKKIGNILARKIEAKAYKKKLELDVRALNYNVTGEKSAQEILNNIKKDLNV